MGSLSGGLIGGLIGLGVGVVDFIVFGKLMERLERDANKRNAAKAIGLARSLQLLVFPVVGYFIGSMLL